jgi:UDP-2,4-diacetamido-2,4,6-trideoxy-beta-L-altropyranose hydrolase
VVFLQAKNRIVFYANNSHEVGAGHIMRLYALAQAAQDRFEILFIYKECTSNLIKKLHDEGFATQKISSPLQHDELASLNASAVFIDDYYLTACEWKTIANIGCFVVALDDEINTDALLADLVINPAPNTNLAEYKKRAPMAAFCFGPQFTYLRREFSNCRFVPLQSRDIILLTLGGTDSKSLALPLCKALLALPNKFKIQLLLGKAHQDQTELEQLQTQFPNFCIVSNPPSVAKHMMQAGLAVSAAGGTLGELASLGVPILALVTVDNQLPTLISAHAESWYRAIDFRHFDAADETSQHNIQLLKIMTEMVQDLWRDNCSRLYMSEHGRQLVDSQGCQRVIDKLNDCLEMSFKSK